MLYEIRNRLEALNNLIYLGLERADEPETVRQYLRLAQEQAAALGEISSYIPGFARSSRFQVNLPGGISGSRAPNPQESA